MSNHTALYQSTVGSWNAARGVFTGTFISVVLAVVGGGAPVASRADADQQVNQGAAGTSAASSTTAANETAQKGDELEEVIVTARKREESIMRSPVIVQAITETQIADLHIDSLQDLSDVVPGLKTFYGYASTGITINLRGLGASGGANYVDQSVGLNIDGAGLSNGNFYRAGMFDLAQIQVLKGPQSLFFGKSTTAGLVVINSADPTDQWDTQTQVGYEINAQEVSASGYVSGPLTDKLGVRLAVYHDSMSGWLTNPNPDRDRSNFPDQDTNAARLTLKYDDPEVGLRVKFKLAGSLQSIDGWEGDFNEAICPSGYNPVPIYRQYDNCRLGTRTLGNPNMEPYNPNVNFNAFNAAAFQTAWPSPLFKNGDPYSDTNTASSVLTVDYDLRPSLTLTSVSAWSNLTADDAGADPTPTGAVGLAEKVVTHEYSEELRLTSNWKDSWINFMIGALYDPRVRNDHFALVVPTVPIPGLGTLGLYTDNRLAFSSVESSGFGQVLLTPVEHWELSAGVRFTHINEYFTTLIAENNYPTFFFPGPSGENIQNVPSADKSFNQSNTSPEVTLTYRPTDDLTAFVSYKQGYKGPGFNADLEATTYNGLGSTAPFGGEKVKGEEGGVKMQLLNRTLALTATGYLYNYTGLQVSFTDVSTNTTTVANGANARVQGIELGADYLAFQGLTLNAFVNYNDSHFTSFPFAPCYGNQSVAEGCTHVGALAYQNLGGRPLTLAPKVTGNLGATYKTNITDKYAAWIQVGADYSSSYYVSPELHPYGIQGSYATIDAALHFGKSDASWDLALICRDCNNRIYALGGLDGGTFPGGQISTVLVDIARPQQIMLQFTMHPNRLF